MIIISSAVFKDLRPVCPLIVNLQPITVGIHKTDRALVRMIEHRLPMTGAFEIQKSRHSNSREKAALLSSQPKSPEDLVNDLRVNLGVIIEVYSKPTWLLIQFVNSMVD